MQKNSRTKLAGLFSAERKSRLLPVAILSILLPAMILVIAPFEIYCNNLAELTFSAGDFLKLTSLVALLAAFVFFMMLMLVPRVAYRILYPALVGFLLMLFVQTNYLNGSLSSLAGDGMESATPTATYVWNTAVWVIVIVGVVLAFQFVKIRKTSQLIATVATVAIGVSQLMNFTVASLTTEGAYDSAIDRVYGEYEDNPRFLTYKGLDTVGSERNVIFICIDRVDALLYMEPAMKKYPETFAKLDGFTYYSDAVSMYGYTFPSVAYMLTGIEYDNGEHNSFFKRAYNENATIAKLHEYGYSIRLYNEAYYDYTNANDLPDYVENSVETDRDTLEATVRYPWSFIWAMTKMSFYRSLPFLLKDTVGSVNSDTCNGFIWYQSEDLEGQKNYSYELKDVYDEIVAAGESFSTGAEKTFTFLHVSGCHEADYDENWNKTRRKDYLVSAKNTFELINTYLDSIRELSPELYRDSTIVIMADHGKVDQRHEKLRKPMLSALLVKPSGEAGTALRTSDAPVSISNVWASIFQSEGLDYDVETLGKSVFDVEREFAETGIYPERKFIWTRRNKNMSSYDSITYAINGKASQFSSWSIVKTEFFDHPLFAR